MTSTDLRTKDRSDPGAATPLRTGGRLRSVDVARGIVVGLSAILSHIPDPAYTFSRHAEWYGIHLLDFILPGFLTLFGTGIALAYRKGIRWRRLTRRTVLLVLIGLMFNAVVGWTVNPDTWRLTGVLQLFAVVGLVVTSLTRLTKSWWQALIAAGVLLVSMQLVLLAVGSGCANGLPQPECTPSTYVDPAVFGESHLYRQFDAGYDPEGLPVMVGAAVTVLLGYVAGEVLWRYRARGAGVRLTALAVLLLATVPLAAANMPINKRIWTPSYALVTAAAPILLLAITHLMIDRLPAMVPRLERSIRAAAWLPEAFGRNSLLVYFGKYLVAAVLAHVTLAPLTGESPIAAWLYENLAHVFARPALAYSAVMFLAWAAVAAVLHNRGRYLKV